MEWLAILIAAFALLGVLLAIRERRTGRGSILDERNQTGQTEADRERIRAESATITRHGCGHAGDDNATH
ncbi:hypothetical protein ACERZ8_18015 [Tateyamaria armeniaca]|uniref:Uncharacterized protein n=1 Tax=Tateyamaria armeniaca TaxID=2518930 RepID=A0ABW8V2R1_9RHOB